MLKKAGLDAEGARQLYKLFALTGYHDRHVIPPQVREGQQPEERKRGAGVGIIKKSRRAKL